MHKKRPLTRQELRKRALKGWETRRKNNPNLKNIHKVGSKEFEWRRPNGEVVPLSNLSDKQVELIAPAMRATDEHMKTHRKLNTEIRGERMLFHNYVTAPLTGMRTGGYVVPARAVDKNEVSPAEKALFKLGAAKVPMDAWGTYNPTVLNLHSLNHADKEYHPAGITAHEIGHLTGPGVDMSFSHNKYARKNAPEMNVRKFEENFQWEAPRVNEKDKVDRKEGTLENSIKTGAVDVKDWHMKADHPHAVGEHKRGKNKGLAKEYREYYQSGNPREDFAETYRTLVGVPMDLANKGKKRYDYWEDKNDSRRKYMTQMHLKSVAAVDQYKQDLEEGLDKYTK